ncbi:MAG: hypothetical protein D6725_16280 [Planctomycetota bacterium]|nr:MAG: hypothetical protein D6725_16280 [Planctomycetota bacterium]
MSPGIRAGKGLRSRRGTDAVARRLKQAIKGIDDREAARQALIEELAAIRNEILNGTFPPK